MSWYALKVRSSQEKKIADRILQALQKAGVSHWVRDILVPMERVLEARKGGKKREKDKIFMPGYLFLDVASEEVLPELMTLVRSVPDVLYFVSPARRAAPVPLSESEIQPILQRVRASAAAPLDTTQTFEVGQLVRIIEGPFKDFEGYVAEVYPEKQRIQVRVRIFNRETPVELPYSQAEKKS
ncbi:MAG: transcription termination/antitermination protein NusG [Bacteroidia bacterium]